MRKFIKILSALILALSLMGVSACNILDKPVNPDNPDTSIGGDKDPDKDPENPDNGDKDPDKDPENPENPDDPIVTPPTVYNVTYVTNGGTLIDGIESYTEGEGINLPTNISKQYYIFEGWYTDSDFGGSAVTEISSTDKGDKTYYAKWRGETYSVSLYIDNVKYTDADNVTSYTYNTQTTLPAPQKNGYTFDGWYTDIACTQGKTNIISISDNGNKKYYAKWVENEPIVTPPAEYSITYITNGGILNGSIDSYTEGEGVNLPTTISKQFYIFEGWYTDSNFGGSAVTEILSTDKGNKTYYAKWKGETYSVSLYINNEKYTGNDNVTSYIYNTQTSLPTPQRNGYMFDGWYTDINCTQGKTNKIGINDNGNKDFYAKWVENEPIVTPPAEYSITYVTNGGILNGSIDSYTEGEGVQLPVTISKQFYIFEGWYTDSDFGGSAVTEILSSDKGDKTYYAKWKGETYSVSLYIDNEKYTGNDNVTSYTYNTQTPLPAPQKNGYTFDGWYTDIACTQGKTNKIGINDNGNKDFYAKWVENEPIVTPPAECSITYVTNGGILNGSIDSYTEGEGVQLPVTISKQYYIFEGWYTDSDFGGSAVTEISSTDKGDKTYYAKWKGETYSVSLYINNEKYTGNDNVTSYTYNTQTPLPAPQKNGYTFDGWYTDINCTQGKTNKIGINDNGNKDFYAKWVEIGDNQLILSAYGGYEEGAYVEFAALNGVESYTVEYKKKSDGDSKYTAIDSELIRINNGTVRADIVGIPKGDYTVRVTAGSASVTTDVAVTSYDRSGYAHFNLSGSDYKDGLGGYNTDGTPKNGAYIIYVTEETKNTVVCPWNSKKKGIVGILGDASKVNKPVIIRIIGTIGAATWNEIDYSKVAVKGQITPDILIANTPGNDGAKLSKKTYSQADLIKGGFNSLNTSVYAELEGLSSQMKYDSSKTEFDSCWNDCQISGAKNVTVEGIGSDAKIFQWGMTWKKCYSIEVRNITFDDYTEDACSFEGGTDATTADKFDSQRIWVHNNVFCEGMNYWDVCNEQDKHDGDGSTDFKKCSYITISYNHYIKTHKTGLIGGSNSQMTASVTFHHNFYDTCKSRLPLARQANMHMYNNYYYNTTDTCLSIRASGYAFIENCYFDNAKNPLVTQDGGVIKAYNCEFNKISADTKKNAVTIATDRTQKVENTNAFGKTFDTDTKLFYYDSVNKKSNVERMDAAKDVPTVVKALAGVHH